MRGLRRYEDLKGLSPSVEGQIDPSRRANYLSDADFKARSPRARTACTQQKEVAVWCEQAESVLGKADCGVRFGVLEQKVMGCTPDEFEVMKEWKKTDLKKKAGLF